MPFLGVNYLRDVVERKDAMLLTISLIRLLKMTYEIL